MLCLFYFKHKLFFLQCLFYFKHKLFFLQYVARKAPPYRAIKPHMLEHYIAYIRLFGAKNSGIDTQLSERSHKLSKEAFNRTNKQFGTTSRDMLRVVLARNVIKDFCKIRNIALDGIQEEENLEKEDDVEAVLVDEEENVLDEEGAEEAKVVDEDS